MASRIEDYAMLGNCRSAALVARNGSIDWLCLPRFDSAACFAALLGDEKNGRWALAPADPDATCTRSYIDGSLVLESVWTTATGMARVIDFMPFAGEQVGVTRIVEGIEGRVDFESRLTLRFDYGNALPWVTTCDDGTLTAVAGPDMVALRTPAEMEGEGMESVGRFSVGQGDAVPFLSLIHISEPTRPSHISRMPSSA